MNKLPNAGFPPLIIKTNIINNNNRFINSVIKNNINIKEIIDINNKLKKENNDIIVIDYF